MSLTILGTIAFDNIETPFSKAEMIVGGTALYASIAASYFKENVKVVSIVGDDFPKEELENLNSRKINTEGIEVKKGEKTFFWAGRYHVNERTTLVTNLNVMASFKPKLPVSYQLSDYLFLGNLHPEAQIQALEQMTKPPKLTIMDTMNFWMDNAWNKLLKLIAKIDILTINEEEARQLSGEHSLVKAAIKILRMGPKYLIIKKGEHGSLLFHKDQIFSVPALPLAQVVDPTGAGDSFAGGLVGYIAKTNEVSFENMKRAIIYGSALASFCVEQHGILGLKKLNQAVIYKRVQKIVDLMYFKI